MNSLKIAEYSQTQWWGRFLLVTTRTFPAALEIGIAQHTTRGTARPFVAKFVPMVIGRGIFVKYQYASGVGIKFNNMSQTYKKNISQKFRNS